MSIGPKVGSKQRRVGKQAYFENDVKPTIVIKGLPQVNLNVHLAGCLLPTVN